MKTTFPQLALREWRRAIARKETLAVLGGIAAVLALTGPFGTDTALRIMPRLIYWAVIVVATYSAGHLASGTVEHFARGRISRLPIIAMTAMAIGAAVTLVVVLINWATFGLLPDENTLPPFMASTFGIALVISVVFSVLERESLSEMAAGNSVPLLSRLPIQKRGALIAITVEDHYVRIVTTKGSEMVLLRLSDAIREVGATQGLQVHRSHWIAKAAVIAATRKGDGAVLQMQDGMDIPVSRANLAKLKEVGLLPR